jgi:hypothetical protein
VVIGVSLGVSYQSSGLGLEASSVLLRIPGECRDVLLAFMVVHGVSCSWQKVEAKARFEYRLG